MKIKSMFVLSIVLACVAGLSACGTLTRILDRNALAGELLLQQGTARAIQAGKTPAEQQARAAKFVAVASDIQRTFDTTVTDLPGFLQLVGTRVAALKLSPADALLVQDMLKIFGKVVQDGLCPPGATPSTTCSAPEKLTLHVHNAIGVVISTAQVYLPAAS